MMESYVASDYQASAAKAVSQNALISPPNNYAVEVKRLRTPVNVGSSVMI